MTPLEITAAILKLAPPLQSFVADILKTIKGAPSAPAAARRVILLAGRRAILRA
jgi:hypothetical protein